MADADAMKATAFGQAVSQRAYNFLLETDQPITPEEASLLLEQAPGVTVIDDQDYPTVVTHAASQDSVFVGRIRKDLSHPHGLDLWVVSDNVRKGAALNAIQIAEMITSNSFYLH